MHQLWRWMMPALAGLALLFLAPHALAQAPSDNRLTNLNIQVSPEYDKPSVYVQIDGEVAAKDKLPQDVSLLIPTGADLNAAAYLGTDGSLLLTDTPKVQDVGDGFTQITFSIPAAKFRVEYYYNPLQGSPDKTMTYVYKGVEPADNVRIAIQQPLKATNFKTDPEAVVKTPDSEGFTLHQFNYATLDAGKPVSIKVSYTKTDPNPSITPQPPQAPAQSSANTPATSATNNTELVGAGLIALALALAALGGFYWWSRNRQEPVMASAAAGSKRARSRKSGSRTISSSSSGSSRVGTAGFCPQCGRALTADDNFCPKCGTPRRKS